MLQFHFKLLLSLFLIFAFPALLIRAQPYDDGNVRALLIPEDCPAPCFMGIRPGMTTADEAVALLQKHEWVQSVNRFGSDVLWLWNGREPDFLQGLGTPSLSTATMPGMIDRIVSAINLPTHLPSGYIFLLASEPSAYRIDQYNRTLAIRYAPFSYLSLWFKGFQIGGLLGCPPRIEDFWTKPIQVTLPGDERLFRYWPKWNGQKMHKILWHNLDC